MARNTGSGTTATDQADQLVGTIENIKGPFGKTGNWYIVSISGPDDIETVTGCMPPSMQIGDTYRFFGKTKSHPTYGLQFAVASLEMQIPKGKHAICAYLARHCPNVGPATAVKIVDKFGDSVFEVLRDHPGRLAEVKGISQARAEQIQAGYVAIEDTRTQDMFFAEHGITLNLRDRLREFYGIPDSELIEILKTDPYQLADDVKGIGFKKADRIGLSVGIAKESHFRLRAGVLWVLRELSYQGHVYTPEKDLVETAFKLLEIQDRKLVMDAVRFGVLNQVVIKDRKNLYLPDLHAAEKRVADRLRRLVAVPYPQSLARLTEMDLGFLDDDQMKAIEMVLENRVIVITGGPGVGKTTVIKKIIEALGNRTILLAAPTGKAAKRMEESTGEEAKTIHRMLEFNRRGDFARNAANPLAVDTLIVDESSMIDIRLMDALVCAVPKTAQVIFVGDKDQLPSVGPGRVLGDMIASGIIPVAELTVLHRQGAGSGIDKLAKVVNRGGKVEFSVEKSVTLLYGDTDVVFHREEERDRIADRIGMYVERISASGRFGLEDIQVLTPQKIGPIGSYSLNGYLRDRIYNPNGQEVKGTRDKFRVGDRVIQGRNNYDIGVFNGETGRILSMYGKEALIRWDGKGSLETPYPVLDMEDDLSLAYAMSVHKSQGSEFRVVVMPVHTANWIMLKQDLFYTGLTRAKEALVLIGSDKAVKIAIKTLDGRVRHSALAERLKTGAGDDLFRINAGYAREGVDEVAVGGAV